MSLLFSAWLAFAACGPVLPPPDSGAKVPTLRWQLPEQRMNGDLLPPEEIATVEIWYTPVNSDEPQQLAVVDGATQEYQPAELDRGSYQFWLVANDTHGLQSMPSQRSAALFIP